MRSGFINNACTYTCGAFSAMLPLWTMCLQAVVSLCKASGRMLVFTHRLLANDLFLCKNSVFINHLSSVCNQLFTTAIFLYKLLLIPDFSTSSTAPNMTSTDYLNNIIKGTR